MSVRLKRLLSDRYYQKLLSLPQSYFDNELSGTVINRLTRTIDNITRFMQMMSNNFVSMLLTIFLSLVLIGRYSFLVALIVAALFPIYFILTQRTSARWQAIEKDINHEMDRASGRFSEVINQVKVVKSFIQEKRELLFFRQRFNASLKLTRGQSKFWHTQDVYRRVTLAIAFFGMYAILIWQASHGTISPGTFATIILLVGNARFPITNMSFIVENAQRAIAGSRDYFSVMELEPAIVDAENAPVLNVNKGAIVFDRVNFGYDDTLVLKDISFSVKPGSKVALVGESGEGKTTITNLLMRLYQPQKGTIMIDDQLITAVSQHSLRESIGVVFQDPALFSGTIRENITYARPEATEKEIISAAKAANAHEFIVKLEKGYGSTIGERGVKLSGGQKQRIAIARALLKNAPILILDEATSSLDSKSEIEVQEALERLMEDRTTIIIAHRLSTIASVDQIVTIRQGRVDEVGSPKTLAQSGGIYAQLLKLQQREPEEVKESLKKFEII
jgi:ATP-binding cassette subfamily B protein